MLKIIRSRKGAKLEWLQDPSRINEDNLNNVGPEACRHFRNEMKEYLKDQNF
jgi:Fe-S cluster biosynthesis and repair protein YggX